MGSKVSYLYGVYIIGTHHVLEDSDYLEFLASKGLDTDASAAFWMFARPGGQPATLEGWWKASIENQLVPALALNVVNDMDLAAQPAVGQAEQRWRWMQERLALCSYLDASGIAYDHAPRFRFDAEDWVEAVCS